MESANLSDSGAKREVNNLQDWQLDSDPYTLFIHAMKSPITKEKYKRRLMIFFDFIKIPGDSMKERCVVFAKNGKNTNWIFNNILQFVLFHRERINRKEISGATLFNYLKAIKLFCEMSDISINWKKLTRGLSRGRRYANDRAPSLEEIKKIIQYPDRRIKPIVYVMCSSGIRLSAWDYLKWKNVIPINNDKEDNNKIIAAKLIVYAEEEEEYFTFISSEAYNSLREWMNYRKAAGESINSESWLMRNLWDVTTPTGKGLATIPVQLKSSGLKRLMERALWAQGIRTVLEKGKKRHEFQVDHGYRKFFKTRCELAGMKPINVERLLSHSTGISDSYYRATENELLEDYLKVMDFLTINEENRLSKQIKELQEKNQDNEYIIKGKLQEKEDQIKSLIGTQKIRDEAVSLLSDQVSTLIEEITFLKKQVQL
jgi:integrase